MPARSVSELLPKPFDELELDDVREIVSRVGEERESLFFERKAFPRPDLLAKGCAAFANSMGGLILFGIDDESDEIIGFEPKSAEPQVWVKDVLRPSVVPMPPFRARHIHVSQNRYVLLVLVQESSTPPHLLTRQGAIYVRNPASSDPVPIADQGRLVDLQRRGEHARDRAVQRARDAATWRFALTGTGGHPPRRPLTVALASTGVAEWFEDRLLHDPSSVDRLAEALPDAPHQRPTWSAWEQHALTVHRVYPRAYPGDPALAEMVRVTRDGVVLRQIGFGENLDDDIEKFAHRDEVGPWIQRAFAGGRELLLDLGAHGDVRLFVGVAAPRSVLWSGSSTYRDVNADLLVEIWTALDLDPSRSEDVHRRIETEIGRALGIPPPSPAN